MADIFDKRSLHLQFLSTRFQGDIFSQNMQKRYKSFERKIYGVKPLIANVAAVKI